MRGYLFLAQTAAQVADKTIQQIMQRLDALGAKLGVAAGALWGIYLRQGYVEGIRDTAISGAGMALVVFYVYIFPKFVKWDFDNRTEGILTALVTCGMSGLAVASCMGLYTGIGELLNPAYVAIHMLIQDIHGL